MIGKKDRESNRKIERRKNKDNDEPLGWSPVVTRVGDEFDLLW